MATVTHPFVSAVTDLGETGLVSPNDWNAAHTITGLPHVPIKDYAAVGDNSADDTTPFINWMAAIDNNAAVGFLNPGTYRVDIETLYSSLPNASNVTIFGGGPDVSVLKAFGTPNAAGGRALFNPGASTNLSLNNFSIAGFGDLTNRSQAILGTGAGGIIKLRNIKITDWQAIHTSTSGGYTVDVADSSFAGVQQTTNDISVIHIPGTTADTLRLRNVDISHFGVTSNTHSHGIYTYTVVSLDLDGVRFTDGAGGWCMGLGGPDDSTAYVPAATSLQLRNIVFNAGACLGGLETLSGGTMHLSDSVFMAGSGTQSHITVNGAKLIVNRCRFVGEPTLASLRSFFATGASEAHFTDCDFEQTSAIVYQINTNGNVWTFDRCRFPSRTMAQAAPASGSGKPVWINCTFSDTTGPNTGTTLPALNLCGDGTRWWQTGTGGFIVAGGSWVAT